MLDLLQFPCFIMVPMWLSWILTNIISRRVFDFKLCENPFRMDNACPLYMYYCTFIQNVLTGVFFMLLQVWSLCTLVSILCL